MKKKIIAITLLLGISLYCFAEGNSRISYMRSITYVGNAPDTIPALISNMNLGYYHGKPVDTLLSYLPSGITDMRIMGWHNLRRADVLYVCYPNNVFVAIFVRKFRFMNPNGAGNNPPNLNWDINLFKKEDISYVVAFNGVQCINGCQFQYK